MIHVRKTLRKGKRLIKQILGQELSCQIQYKCTREYFGTELDGWCVCPDMITPDSIVYSFRVGQNISFDLAMMERFGVHIYAFDPTPDSIEWIQSQKLPAKFHLFEYGIANYDGTTVMRPAENMRWDKSYSIL
jgi:hypothetical protein